MKKAKLFLSILFLIMFCANLNALTSFTGFAGGKLDYQAEESDSKYNPDLNLSVFFSGQFSFSENLWSHLEFSIKTEDLLNQSLFSSTMAAFQVDELSLIGRKQTLNGYNYFSTYIGTYDPIGSDIFLQRYFGLQPIGTKLADTYLGIAGSILYPHFGIGIADIIKPNNVPIAYGAYLYLNNEDSQYFVVNADLRFATALRYFTFDFCGGIGAPLYDTYKGESVFLVISKIYFHAGTTILIGNNYTPSLFIQTGIFNSSYEKGGSWNIKSDSIYLLVEPRFVTKNSHINISFYTLPQTTVDKFLFIEDTLGFDVNIYSDTIPISSKIFTLGVHLGFGLPNKNILSFQKENKYDSSNNLENLISDIKKLKFDVNITPYISTELLGGNINALLKIGMMDFVNNNWYKALRVELGYKKQF